MIIDFHAHIFSPRIIEQRQYYSAQDATFATLYNNPKARLATAEELIASMDEAGVDVSVVVNIGWARNELCVENNTYILEAVSRYSKRLVSFCSVNPRGRDAALKEMERCAMLGAKGIGELHPDFQGFDLWDEGMMRPIVNSARSNRMVMLIHSSEPVGHLYAGKGSVTPEVLYRFLSIFPDVPVVCAHWGGGLPFYALMPEVGESLENVYFDTAASPFLYKPAIYNIAQMLIGSSKILWGSDFPLVSHERALREVRDSSLTHGEKAHILGENAVRLLKL